MIKIGITGGIGSGKSVVASLLQLYGIPVYVADTESKILTDNSPVIREKLTALFGKDIYTEKGLNKKLLASYIFSDPECLQKVNAIIHPEVNRHFSEWTKRQKSDICAIESAILFESGFDKVVDKSLMVYAPAELRIERAILRDTVSREEIIRRIDNQMPDEIKKDRSDYVIYNDDIQALLPQIEKLLASLQNSFAK
ncbi:dephospho-CoA kinase [Parabacteroides sp.]